MSIAKEYIVGGKTLAVYDDLFSFTERSAFNTFAKSSLFRPSADTGHIDELGQFNLASHYSLADAENMGLLVHPNVAPILAKADGYAFVQARVNLSTMSDTNHFHVDSAGRGEAITVLCYLNMKWDLEWGGYTLFANESRTEVELAIAPRAGRLVVFDGSIPHCIAPPTRQAPAIRMTFAAHYARSKS